MAHQIRYQPFDRKPLAILFFEAGNRSNAIPSSQTGNGFADALSEELKQHFRVAPVIHSCSELWPLLFNEIPSVMIFSQTLREVDAVALIRSFKSSRHAFDIRYFLCSAKATSSIKSICKLNGIDGCFSEEDDPSAVAKTVYESYKELEKSAADRRLQSIREMYGDDMFFNDRREIWELGAVVSEALFKPIGLNTEHIGTKYLELIIGLRLFGVPKNMRLIYVLCADCFGVSAASVEKAVRYSIERAWTGSSPYMQYKLFGNSVDPERGKPTNSEFVETIVRHTIERLCC